MEPAGDMNAPNRPTPSGGSPDTDLANARRLVARHGADIRYCHGRGVWFVWDGNRWKQDDNGEIDRRAKETACSIYAEAGALGNKDDRLRLAKWARKSESAKRLSAMIQLARSEPEIAVTPAELDRDLWIFNCLNGSVDLKTGLLRDHRRQDQITKLAPVAYDPDAHLDEWDRFLTQATGGDEQLSGFLRRAVGYSLTGEVSEEVLFFVHGPAATGKSTFLEAIKSTLGDFARTADFESFLKRSQVGGIRNDIARLAGSRFVISIEVEDGKQLAEGLVKMLTGGDTVTARFLYKESFEFLPSAKFWLAANHAPKVKADDSGMWRRILRVPFEQVVPKDQRDPRVKAILRNPTLGGPAILAWAVRGCMEWQRAGLGVPRAVQEATESYRREMNPLEDFIREECMRGENLRVPITVLWNAYEIWAETKPTPLSRGEFNRHMESLGFVQDRIGKNRDRVWCGIALAPGPDAEREGGQADSGGQYLQ
jgi:putative DNA primase/helicase